jgi:hypothetical protein
VHLTFVKFYERALVDAAHDIIRVEPVCSLAKKYYKTIPMAVISNNKYEDVIQLLTSVGILHLFDVIIAQEPHKELCSQVDMFASAAKRLNQRVDVCIGECECHLFFCFVLFCFCDCITVSTCQLEYDPVYTCICASRLAGLDGVDSSSLALQRRAGRRMFDVRTLPAPPSSPFPSCSSPPSCSLQYHTKQEGAGHSAPLSMVFFACGGLMSMCYYLFFHTTLLQ